MGKERIWKYELQQGCCWILYNSYVLDDQLQAIDNLITAMDLTKAYRYVSSDDDYLFIQTYCSKNLTTGWCADI